MKNPGGQKKKSHLQRAFSIMLIIVIASDLTMPLLAHATTLENVHGGKYYNVYFFWIGYLYITACLL